MNDPYKSIIPLVELKSSLTDYKKFHQAVNKTFHNVEAKYYDEIHEEMWQNLPAQLNLLIGDLLNNSIDNEATELSLIDIGCGTGLATHLLLQTGISKKIKNITLLDTSPVMLSHALKRASGWNKTVTAFEGEIAELDGKFDFIIISSVLHHIPDLTSFVNSVAGKLYKGGILLCIHDPLQEAISSETYKNRCSEYFNIINRRRKNIVKRIFYGLKRRIIHANNPDFIGETNSILLNNNIIHTPLTEVEIWSITDIHVEGLPYASSQGISITWLQNELKQLELISYRTYSFFRINAAQAK